jgi:hypothetical protein
MGRREERYIRKGKGGREGEERGGAILSSIVGG